MVCRISARSTFTVAGKRPYARTKRLKEFSTANRGVTGWVFHDIRRTVRAAGWPMAEETAELVLNHAKKGLNKVYNPNRYLKEMRAAMEAWADHVAFIVGDGHDAANVVSFNDKHAVA
jgi:hypothetical protein